MAKSTKHLNCLSEKFKLQKKKKSLKYEVSRENLKAILIPGSCYISIKKLNEVI